jgi:hypothetical protein
MIKITNLASQDFGNISSLLLSSISPLDAGASHFVPLPNSLLPPLLRSLLHLPTGSQALNVSLRQT